MEHVNHNIFKYICSLLTECDLFALRCVNKKFYKWVKRYYPKAHNCNKFYYNINRAVVGCFRFVRPYGSLTELLSFAAINGHLHVCKHILKLTHSKYDLCADQAFGFAAAHGYLEICKWICQNIIYLDIHSNDEYAFRTAAANGHYEVCNWLIDNYEINLRARKNEASTKAFQNGHFKICELILINDTYAVNFY